VRFAPERSAPAEVRLKEARLDEIRVDEIRFDEVRLAEVCAGEVHQGIQVLQPPGVPGVDALAEKRELLLIGHRWAPSERR
jgi:hypothetical protein